MQFFLFDTKKVQSPFFIFSMLFAIIVLWFIGGVAYKYSIWPFAGVFGDISDLQNVFSPVNALFAGIAVWGAVYTIFMQVVISARQQFEDIFFNLLNIHNSNRDRMIFPKGYGEFVVEDVVGQNAFVSHYEFLREIYAYVLSIREGGSYSARLDKKISEDIEDIILQSKDDDGNIELSDKELFRVAYEIYTGYTDVYYSGYARNLYHALKYTNEESFSKNKKIYVRILRSQLSIHEAALLYYRALLSKDKLHDGSGATKYQKLIEKTSFLHLLCDDMGMLFDAGMAGKMEDSAFCCDHCS